MTAGTPSGSTIVIVRSAAKLDCILKLTMSPWRYSEARVLTRKVAEPTVKVVVVFRPLASVPLIV